MRKHWPTIKHLSLRLRDRLAAVPGIRPLWRFIDAFSDAWSDDRLPRQSAAIAYFALFSMAPLLWLATGIISQFLGQQAVTGELHNQLSGFMGAQAANSLESLVKDVKPIQGGPNTTAALIGAATLIYGATGVFVELKDSLNLIWGLRRREGRSVVLFLKDRLLSFAMVLIIGALLMASVLVSGVFAFIKGWVSAEIAVPVEAWSLIAFVVAFAIETLLFAIIFKVLPDLKFPWRDVWMGALVTALLFEAGKFGLGWYLARTTTLSGFGAAGSVVLLLIWVYYSSLIVLTGAEFIEITQRLRGTPHGRKPSLAEGGTEKDTPIERIDGLSS
jgi:membrane protein